MFELFKNNITSNKENEVREIFNELFKYIPDSKEQKDNLDNKIFDSGVFLDDFNDIIEEVKRPICLQVSLESEQCSECQAVYCKKCIIEKSINICSSCRKIYNGIKLDRVLSNVMGHLLIKCENCHKFGNKQNKIKLSQIKEHLLNCEYSSYQCLKCNKIFLNSKRDCITHAFTCGYVDVTCNYCKKTIKAYQKEDHEKKCAEEKIECNKCYIRTKRKNMENHKKKECTFREIICKDCHEKYIFNEGHTKEKCLINQNELLRSIIADNLDKLNISDENVEFLKIHPQMRKQNTETDFLLSCEKYSTFYSEKSSESKFNHVFKKSSLINNENDIKYILGLFKNNIKKFNLIYKMTEDGDKRFHSKCDNINNTLSLIKIKNMSVDLFSEKIEEMRIYGGFAEEKWNASKKVKTDPKSFIFSFTDKSKPFYCKSPFHSIICNPNYGPSFGIINPKNKKAELWIKGKEGGYEEGCIFGEDIKICTGGAREFTVLEIEVFQIIFE